MVLCEGMIPLDRTKSRKEIDTMKRILKITALTLAMLMMAITLASCGGPAADPAKAEAALKENGYLVTLQDGAWLEGGAALLGYEDLEASLTGIAKDNFIQIYYFETAKAANNAWEKATKEAEKEGEGKDNFVVEKSGKMIYFGTKEAVKAAK